MPIPDYFTAKCCPHIDNSSIEYVDLVKLLALSPNFRCKPTPDDDPIPLEKLQPWIDMMRELLLESHLSLGVIDKLMLMYVPRKHHHAIGYVPLAKRRRTFRQFPKLPAHTRATIWKIVAERPPRVLFWRNDYDKGRPSLNSPAKMPTAARVCKEARDAITPTGGYCDMQCVGVSSAYRPSSKRARPVWVSANDLVFALDGMNHESAGSESWVRAYNFLRSRKEIAVGETFAVSSYDRLNEGFAFLRDMDALDTLVCVIAAPEVSIWTDINIKEAESPRYGILDTEVCVIAEPNFTFWTNNDDEDSVQGMTKQQIRTTKLLQKLVLPEDREELEKMDALWRGVGPEWRWLSRPNADLLRVNQAAYAPKLVSRCIDCQMRDWNDTGMAKFRTAWLRLLYGDHRDVIDDRDIYPNRLRGEPDLEHPWVQQALARMPKLKPAVLLTFEKRPPKYDKRGQYANHMDRVGHD
ncbi:uncharacterized protein B0H64DRAFT_451043 [Chaetomium fimeti]|uniref:2EXR domain-containing protein n=1 Tax=Chaetomium fimeti TaxID=1854472 RepID=A0AAE0H9B9_9PEZI|nr:hypothetical protein B0H64DRAFT_451043 [Chaetomium fimeti]